MSTIASMTNLVEKAAQVSTMFHSAVLADSYKYTHYGMYPKDMTGMFSYIEPRGGMYPEALFFGLSGYLQKYLSTPVTKAEVDEFEDIINSHIVGERFNRTDWDYILNKHGGYLPVRIRAPKEGSIIPVHNVMTTTESTDPRVPWVANFPETTMLRGVWYPTTVATRSMMIKRILKRYLKMTSDCTAANQKLLWQLHDFGMRGAAVDAGSAGAAHLVNFYGTDTVEGLLYARYYYGEPCAGGSIPATEHSVATSEGRANEINVYRRLIARYGKPGGIFAAVIDSYNMFDVCDFILPQIKQELLASGVTMVLRPDSGDPLEILPRMLNSLTNTFGYTINSKGFKVLNNAVRIIWGDGINENSIEQILALMAQLGWSSENIAFGCGGYLLQSLTRDTMQWAQKTSAILVNGVWIDTTKDPITDPGKRSRPGRITLYTNSAGEYYTSTKTDDQDMMQTVYENGELMNQPTFAEIRQTAGMEDY